MYMYCIDCLKAEIASVLRRMYGEHVPEPEDIHCTKWYSNQLALGSFHSLRTGTTAADLENLSRPIRSLHFAGTLLIPFTGLAWECVGLGLKPSKV